MPHAAASPVLELSESFKIVERLKSAKSCADQVQSKTCGRRSWQDLINPRSLEIIPRSWDVAAITAAAFELHSGAQYELISDHTRVKGPT